MRMDKCLYGKDCRSCKFLYRKQCKRFCQAYVKDKIKQFYKGGITSAEVQRAKQVCRGKVYVTSSAKQVAAVLIAALSNNFRAVKVYHFSSAVEAALSEETPTEAIIIIDTTNKYRDTEKQMQAISSYASKLAESKVVICKGIAQQFGEEVVTL